MSTSINFFNKQIYYMRLLFYITTFAICVCSFAAEPANNFKVTTNHKDGIYKSGEAITWTISGVTSGTPEYTVKIDGQTPFATGKLTFSDGKAIVTSNSNQPGTLLLNVKIDDKTSVLGGAAVDWPDIKPSAPEPSDFDAFWKSKLAELATVSADPQLEEINSGVPNVQLWKITMNNIRGTRIYGFLARPKGDAACPAMLQVQHAGVYPLNRDWVLNPAKSGWLALNIIAHDLPVDKEKSFYDEQSNSGPQKWYRQIGATDREKSYFLRMYLSCYRAADYLANRSDWNKKTLLVQGGSQGGMQTIVTAALHQAVTMATADVPAGCDMTGTLLGRACGFPGWLEGHASEREARLKTAPYYDVVNFAARVRCPVLVGVGLIDTTCPPVGVFAMYNRIPADKRIVIMPQATHTQGHENYNREKTAWWAAAKEGKTPLLTPVNIPDVNEKEITVMKLPETLVSSHPRLLIKPGGWETLKERLNNDELGRLLIQKLLSNAASYLDEAVIDGKRKSPKADLLANARNFEKRITTLAMAYQLSKDDRFLQRAKSEMAAAVKMEDWSPSHFLDTSEILMGISLGYDWLYYDLTPAERAAIRTAIVEKGLKPAQIIYQKGFNPDKNYGGTNLFWANRANNWTSVCHAGQLAGALAIAEDEPERTARIIQLAPEYLKIPLKSYEPLGGYPEGPGYWSYGTTFHVLAGAMLESATGSDRGLFPENSGFSNTVMFELHMTSPNGYWYNYADVELRWYNGISPLFGFLGQRFGKTAAVTFHRDTLKKEITANNNYHKYNNSFVANLLWMAAGDALNRKSEVVPLDAHFPGEADVAVFRSAWDDPNAMYLGFKAGLNGAGHGHQDLGSFLLDCDKVRWSYELGGDTYALPGYFGQQRDSYFRLNNLGHSTLTFGTSIQKRGEGNIYHYETGAKQSGAIADLSRVNSNLANSWKRGVWMLDRSRVLVQDEVDGLLEGTPLHWQMVTSAKITIAKDGRSAILTQDGKNLCAEILQPDGATFDVIDAKPASSAENQNANYRILRANVTGNSGKVRIAVSLRRESDVLNTKDAWIDMK